MEITLDWAGGHAFDATTESGVEVALDGDKRDGVSPMESLLTALASCMAIDVVDILEKGRQAVSACRVVARGERREDPPRRFTRVELAFELAGTDLDRSKAERAVRLSRETYCSVWHSMASDLDMDVSIVLREA